MDHPWILIRDNGSRELITQPTPFIGPGNIQHPAAAWDLWTVEDWAAQCPGWRVLPVIDESPEPAADERIERLPDGQWAELDGAVRVTYQRTALTPAELAARLDDARADKIAEVNAERDRRYEAGFFFEGHVYQIDVESRTDMLAVEAKLNRGEVGPHGGYWRTKANVMVPMDDAKVATFIGAAGDHVGAIKARSWALKDAAAVSSDPTSIDHTVGWPDSD